MEEAVDSRVMSRGRGHCLCGAHSGDGGAVLCRGQLAPVRCSTVGGEEGIGSEAVLSSVV
jgi:hypothetical protein